MIDGGVSVAADWKNPGLVRLRINFLSLPPLLAIAAAATTAALPLPFFKSGVDSSSEWQRSGICALM